MNSVSAPPTGGVGTGEWGGGQVLLLLRGLQIQETEHRSSAFDPKPQGPFKSKRLGLGM
jgi:hypothetical protein